MDFGRFDTFIFDLDGTLWRWQKLYDGVRESINTIFAKGKQVMFVTNNTLLDRSGTAKKLSRMGINADAENVITAGYAMAAYLKRMGDDKKVMVIGRELSKELRQDGIKLSDKPPVDFLAVGMDLSFNMKKLMLAYSSLNADAKFLCASRGKRLVTETGVLPGTGLLVEMIEGISGIQAEIIGKPSDTMCDLIRNAVKSDMKKTILIGDEIHSDIATGKKLGCYTCLVRTGVKEKPTTETKPDFVIDSVADIKF